MRKLTKLLVLALSLALLVGSIFAVASFAAEDDGLSIEGASRTRVDFTGVVFDRHISVDAGVAATPTTAIGGDELHKVISIKDGVTNKYGHIRTVKSPVDGNTYFEWLFEKDDNGKSDGNCDSILMMAEGEVISSGGYYVLEYDMSTRTRIPGKMQIFQEVRAWEPGSKDDLGAYRTRPEIAAYNAAEGKWKTTGTNTFTTDANEWVHITVVYKVVPEFVTVDGVEKVNYKNSLANLYVDGQFVHSIKFMPDIALATGSTVKLHYAGLGYSYGAVHTGTKADDSVVVDNVVKTKIPAAYAADTANDELAPLFAAENPTTDVTDLGETIVYTSEYALPETELGVVSYLTPDGDEYVVASIEDALALMKEDEAQGATIKLLANRYHSAYIDYPCVIDLNGYALQNDYTYDPALATSVDAEAGTITFAYDPANSATFNIYDAPYGTDTDPIKTQVVVAGNTFVIPAIQANIPTVIEGKNAFGPTGEVKIYDAEGKVVSIDTVGDDHKGKTYSVHPVAGTYTFENNVAFYAEKNGGVTFYDTTDICAAAVDGLLPNGMTITLLEDATWSAVLHTGANSNVYIELNGFKLAADQMLLGPTDSTTAGSHFFIYTSKDGAEINTGSKNLLDTNKNYGTQLGNGYYFGWKDSSTKATGRMTITCTSQIAHIQKGSAQTIKFANADIHVLSSAHALISMAQARTGYNFHFEKCNIFTDGTILHASANDATSTTNFIDSNIYGGGNVMFPAHSGGGIRTVNFVNSNVYNMELGVLDGSSVVRVNLDATSKLSCNLTPYNKLEGKIILCIPESVVIDGVTYVTGFQWLPTDTKYATFNYYGVSKDDATADTPVAKTMKIAIGSWWAYTTGVSGIAYDPTVDAFSGYLVESQEFVYDAEGNLVTKTALEEADADKVFSVYTDEVVTDEKVTFNTYAYLKLADNTYLPLEGEKLVAALMAKVGSTTLPEGATLTLVKDCALEDYLYYSNNKIDLNGKTLYYSHKGPEILPTKAGSKLFFYSSQPGARVCVISGDKGGNQYFTELTSAAEAYIGYVDAETYSPNTIDFFTGAFAQVRTADAKLFIANANIAAFGGDNYGVFNFRYEGTTNASITLTNVNVFVDNRNPVFSIRQGATDVVWNVNDSNIYNVGVARSLMGWYEVSETERKATLNLNNTNLYGQFNMPLVSGNAVCTVNVVGTTVLSEVNKNVVLPEGYIAVPLQGVYTGAQGMTILQNGVYGRPEGLYGNKNYAYGIQIMPKPEATIDANAFKAQAFQNMTLDTNVVVNLYIPVSEDILSVVYGKTHLLDKAMVETIGDKQYYVLSVELAPKYGNAQADVVVYFQDGQSVTFPMSVENYAKALFALDGTTNEYVADSQRIMKYVLTYIKEVAVAFGSADAATIFAGLDIAVDTNVTVQEAVKDTTAINTYVTHAALDLDAYAGFAFKVAKDFVGTIRIEMAGVDAVEKTYNEKNKAGENEVLVLQNVPAYLFRGDVTITVTPAGGEAVSAQFNLATYVTANADAYAKALYAYTVEAQAYNTKYPTVNTVK